MRVIIAGSRGVVEYALLERAISQSGFLITTVVSGKARGADRLGELYADREGIPVDPYPADWDRYPKHAAGKIRNLEMAENADALIALWDGYSPGTLDMIRKAKDKNLKYCVFNIDKETFEHSDQK